MFKRTFLKKIFTVVVIGALVGTIYSSFSLTNDNVTADRGENRQSKIKNIIFLIGDGMGPAYNTAYRYLKDDPSTPYMENTAFDDYFVGMQKTYSWDKEESITDSAAAATSLSSGIKTYNGAIAVDMETHEVPTALEIAKEQGKSTGLVSTSQINHATPASFGAHDESRHNYNEIADDYFDEMINGEHKIDVLLGGGTDYFERDDRNLAGEFKQDGYSYVTTKEELLSDQNNQVLGLFAPVGLDYAIDRPENQPSLEEMTNAALERLSQNKDGFFLMVEGSQIDWAGHDNDIVAAMSEMRDFEKAFEVAIEYAKEDPHTLVVTTADHSTGGLTLGIDGEYQFDPAPISAAKRTPDFMAEKIVEGQDVDQVLNEYIDFDLNSDEVQSIQEAAETEDETEIDNAIEEIFNKRSGTGWTTGGHDGVDVNIYAYGPQSELFHGLHDNHMVGQMIMELMNHKKIN
ncbi:alkaline phosphatase [Piscibacillus halophilus]|uniref:alkaline phosphatase n=1 Tax=Piscibacillus halophilus TaxID=571933 RepID=UPI00158E3A03|nr:alkaline phosphatase [Piscibacillus halophilus]